MPRDISEIFDIIDRLWQSVDLVKKEPDFSSEVSLRLSRDSGDFHSDDEVLKIMAKLIAFSQGANSDLVEKMIEDEGVFDEVFSEFSVSAVAQMNAEDIIKHHWSKMKVIRFKKKVGSIIGCANALINIQKKYGSFIELLRIAELPKRIRQHSDIDAFWRGFLILKVELSATAIPFFGKTTTLLHFLLHIGYDCVKPDRIVMEVAKKIGIVSSATGDGNFIKTVETIQRYSVTKDVRPSVVDFYFLVYGGQTWARQFVTNKPYSEIIEK